MEKRGRFAPSPTGLLHLGNARTALLAWLWARANSAAFLLRIEDLDEARSRQEFIDALFYDFEYLGLTWDEAPVYQSQRKEAYRAALEALSKKGKLYRCTCSRADIVRAAAAPHGPSDDGPRYPGTCAARQNEIPPSTPSSLRFRTAPGEVAFSDQFLGPMQQDVHAEVGDFVVQTKDGVASYQLAVVVDDAASKVTHVLRGDDLSNSTPRQLQLYRALDLPTPQYAHVPLVVGGAGERLAKRGGGFTVSEWRSARVPAERVVGLLAHLCGLSPLVPRRSAGLVADFSLDRVPKEKARVDASFLTRWLSP